MSRKCHFFQLHLPSHSHNIVECQNLDSFAFKQCCANEHSLHVQERQRHESNDEQQLRWCTLLKSLLLIKRLSDWLAWRRFLLPIIYLIFSHVYVGVGFFQWPAAFFRPLKGGIYGIHLASLTTALGHATCFMPKGLNFLFHSYKRSHSNGRAVLSSHWWMVTRRRAARAAGRAEVAGRQDDADHRRWFAQGLHIAYVFNCCQAEQWTCLISNGSIIHNSSLFVHPGWAASSSHFPCEAYSTAA